MNELAKLYYSKYKKNFLPATFIIASLFIFFRIAIPQFGSIRNITEDLQKAEVDLTNAQKTVSTINSLNETQLNDYLSLANTALPPSKNISLIFTALSDSASRSNVIIKSYSIDVGAVLEKGEKKNKQKTEAFPFLKVNVQAISSASASLVNFSKNLHKVSPLAEVTRFRISGNEAVLDVNFFYKPIDINALARRQTLEPLTPAELQILDQIRAGEIQ